MEAQGSPGIKASELLIKMSSRHPGHDHGTPGPPSRTVGDAVPSKAFLCLELPVKSKEWAAKEGSCGSTEGLRVRKSTGKGLHFPSKEQQWKPHITIMVEPQAPTSTSCVPVTVLQPSGPNSAVLFPANRSNFIHTLTQRLSVPSCSYTPIPMLLSTSQSTF